MLESSLAVRSRAAASVVASISEMAPYPACVRSEFGYIVYNHGFAFVISPSQIPCLDRLSTLLFLTFFFVMLKFLKISFFIRLLTLFRECTQDSIERVEFTVPVGSNLSID